MARAVLALLQLVYIYVYCIGSPRGKEPWGYVYMGAVFVKWARSRAFCLFTLCARVSRGTQRAATIALSPGYTRFRGAPVCVLKLVAIYSLVFYALYAFVRLMLLRIGLLHNCSACVCVLVRYCFIFFICYRYCNMFVCLITMYFFLLQVSNGEFDRKPCINILHRWW